MGVKQKENNATMMEWLDTLLISLSIMLVILLFFMRTFTVSGSSMSPTLESGERVFAYSFMYTPQKGDIVVVSENSYIIEPIVKRVIATGGDTVDINYETGDVIVNGEVLYEPYISDLTQRGYDVEFPLVVPQGTVFLMGDNRPYSKDSRDSSIGFIDEREVLGKVVFRMYPFERIGLL